MTSIEESLAFLGQALQIAQDVVAADRAAEEGRPEELEPLPDGDPTDRRRAATRTLLLYSESGNPASPHFLDQTTRYAAGQWIEERFTRTEIATHPALRVHVLDPR